MARRAVVRVTPAAESRGVQLELDAPRELPSCETDASRVEQILVNLLGNAIHHSPEGGTVRLGIGAREGMIEYRVDDEGAGIPPTEVERVFDIYVTKSAGESRGAGLGLPLSRRLARLLGGELRAVPRTDEGRGGRFLLELPAAAAEP
jgi:signal transduction histidine kinase